MCMGPEVLIPMALSGAGQVFDHLANRKVEKKTRGINEYYRNKNQQQEDAAQAEFQKATGNFENGKVNELLATMEQGREDTLQPHEAPGMDDLYAGSAPSSIQKDMGRRVVESVKKGKEESLASSRLNSISDVLQFNNLATRDAASNAGMNNNFIGGNSRAQGFETEAAQSAGDGLRTIGDLFGAGGQLYNLYAATGTPKTVTRPAPPVPKRMGYARA